MPFGFICSHDYCGTDTLEHRLCGGCRLTICDHHPDCRPNPTPTEFYLPAKAIKENVANYSNTGTLCSRICVCGGRNYADYDEVIRILNQLRPELIIHGNATGADTLGKKYAISHNVPVEAYAPDRRLDGTGWNWKYNRNSRMLEHGKPTLVVAFPGGTGTADTVRKARTAGIPVIEVTKS